MTDSEINEWVDKVHFIRTTFRIGRWDVWKILTLEVENYRGKQVKKIITKLSATSLKHLYAVWKIALMFRKMLGNRNITVMPDGIVLASKLSNRRTFFDMLKNGFGDLGLTKALEELATIAAALDDVLQYRATLHDSDISDQSSMPAGKIIHPQDIIESIPSPRPRM